VGSGAAFGHPALLVHQVVADLAAPAYAFAVTFALLKLVGAIFPLRAGGHEQALGMDVAEHGEEAYTSGEGAILVLAEGRAESGGELAGVEP